MIQLFQRGGLVIFFTFVLGLIISVLPLPPAWQLWKPEWATLVLIYWCMMLPHRVGVFSGWLLGLFEDILLGAILGQYALALSMVAYFSYRLQTRLRLYPVLQQSLLIMLLIALQQMLILWVRGITGESHISYSYWLPTLSSTLIWPFVAFFLSKIRQLFYIH